MTSHVVDDARKKKYFSYVIIQNHKTIVKAIMAMPGSFHCDDNSVLQYKSV